MNKSSITRDNLSKLLRESGELITVDKAASILQVENDTAAKALARWKNQGWFTRVKRGLYLAVPIEASNSKNVIEDAWLLVPELFSPAYVGGWSAAEYWDLTEQIFRDICVLTSRPVSRRKQVIYNVSFEVKYIAATSQFGTKPVWKKGKKIRILSKIRGKSGSKKSSVN
jgi:predicted transcriptional regulator of viral defense system